MQTWNSTDKSEWMRGEWDDEPDKAQWIDEVSGLDCLIVRAGTTGALCGYVGVPQGHPYFGRDYGDLDVDVHGGLTFSNKCADTEDESKYVCHIAKTAANEAVWWLGFDCAHSGDLCPAMTKYAKGNPIFLPSSYESYRNFDLVKWQTERLSRQLSAIKEEQLC